MVLASVSRWLRIHSILSEKGKYAALILGNTFSSISQSLGSTGGTTCGSYSSWNILNTSPQLEKLSNPQIGFYVSTCLSHGCCCGPDDFPTTSFCFLCLLLFGAIGYLLSCISNRKHIIMGQWSFEAPSVTHSNFCL